MGTAHLTARIACGCLIGFLAWSTVAVAADEELVTRDQVSQMVAVRDIRMQPDGTVAAVLFNQSQKPLRDVRVVIRYVWYWKTERTPGEDSPGRSAFSTVSGEISPGGSMPFTYKPPSPLPERVDGHFRPQVEVMGFTEVGE